MPADTQSLEPILKQVNDKPRLQAPYSNVVAPTGQPFTRPPGGDNNSKRAQGILALKGLIGTKYG
jgi:hypothetical protein